MNCRSAESLFSSLIEDELSQNERRSLEAHLLACRKCSVSLKETRAAMDLFQSLPVEETSPHFEEDVMARIRTGEGLRPSLIEWARGLLEPPAWLRPVAVAGAGACAVWVATLLVNPFLSRDQGSVPIASRETPAPASIEAPAPVTPDVSAAQEPAAAPSGTELASGDVARERSRPRAAEARRSAEPSDLPSDLAAAVSETPAQGFTGGGELPSPGAGYVDEYITDQFYLERGNGGSGTPSVTPVSGRPSDDVYIIF